MVETRPVVYQEFIGFKAKPDERRMLEMLAALRGVTMSEILRQAVAREAQHANIGTPAREEIPCNA